MTDDVAAAPAPVSPGPAEGAGATPTETAAAGLETLAANRQWQEDFSGSNGRPAQIAAAKLKSETTRAAFKPEADTAPALPERVEDGLDAPDAITRAAAEGMAPAASPDEFAFKWGGVENLDLSQIEDMNALAGETAFAAGASKSYAEATVAGLQDFAAKSSGPAPTMDSLQTALAKNFGDKSDAVVADAKATLARMPERGRQWLLDAAEQLDASGVAWLTGRLARVANIHKPKS